MTQPHLDQVLSEWRASRRLRIGTMLIVLVLGLHVAASLSRSRTPVMETYAQDAALLGRLAAAGKDEAWPARAEDAEARLAEVRATIPAVRSDGLAQAELQAWLAEVAASQGVQGPSIRVETSLAVPGQSGLWQVIARLDGNLPAARHQGLFRALAVAPWVRVERLEAHGAEPARVSIVVRAYYRQETGDSDAAAPAPAPGPGLGLGMSP